MNKCKERNNLDATVLKQSAHRDIVSAITEEMSAQPNVNAQNVLIYSTRTTI